MPPHHESMSRIFSLEQPMGEIAKEDGMELVNSSVEINIRSIAVETVSSRRSVPLQKCSAPPQRRQTESALVSTCHQALG